MDILNREIPKLFSEEGNNKYVTNDIEFNFLDDNGNDAYISDWYVSIREARTNE